MVRFKIDRSKQKLLGFLELCRLGNLRFHLLAISLVLLGVAALFEGVSFGLLVPFLKKTAGMGPYEGWRNVPVVGSVLATLHFDEIVQRMDILLVLVIVAVIIRQIASYISQTLYFATTSAFEGQLRTVGYRQALAYSCQYYDSVKKGEIHNILMRFTTETGDLMRAIFDLTKYIMFVLMYVATLAVISPQLCLTVIAISPLFYWITTGLFRKIHSLHSSLLKSEQKGHGLSLDIFSNIKLVKAMGRETDEIKQFEQNEHQRTNFSIKAFILYLLINPLQEIILTIGVAFILWVSFNFYLKDDPSFLIKLIVSILLFRRAIQVVQTFIAQLPVAIRRIPFVREIRQFLNPNGKIIADTGTRALIVTKKGIEYRNVGMFYSPENPVLKNISFFIPAGSFTAIVGSSGSGKTTLAELLPRFYEYQDGDILIDGTSIRAYKLENLRRAIGFVSQDTLVLNDTIYNNIRYAKPDATDTEIEMASQKSHVLDIASRLSAGMNTVIGDKGVKLSGGELQRLAIARVFLRQPLILILDEATSSLDSHSEKLIQDALQWLTKDRTTIAIAHRLSTIHHADQIIVMEDGEIVESGNSQSLIHKQGAFYHYWTAQKF